MLQDLGLNTFDGDEVGDQDSHEIEAQGHRGRDPSQPEGKETVPFMLSEALPVVPARLVKKIRKGDGRAPKR